MSLVREYSRNLGQRSILARKDTFLKRRAPQFYPLPYSIPFLSVLHRNKALYNFRKKGQRSIVERIIGLEYALLEVSNSDISLTLSHPLWKNVSDSKSYVLAVPMFMSLKVLKYFFSGKSSFLLFACLCNEISNRKKWWVFFQKSWPTQQ